MCMQYDIILHFVPVFKPVFLLSVQIIHESECCCIEIGRV
ncbi:hypothetical protein SUBVAR_04968 [Subdoligranulum variabile DSM 15176]|uniref:Uncharacterized protein n=1 Tax=Subdoligranulum variabile DSM 15176 TaxID=411471 RepID=D1PKT4_9FIRM|nr:hypothetical protein SUBVAR_04968 [Subdoligranulum variabile DSM 15176]